MERNKHERNKRYGWLIFFTVLNWLSIALVVWLVDPENLANFIIQGSYLPMGLLLFGGFFWILTILTLSTVRALRWDLGIIIFIYLRLFGLGTILNGILILGLLAIWEVYTYKKKPKENVLHSD
ncbi:MAG TPA: hypothetical protein PLI45_03105 [Candidatus Woesebacteria bacterium]|mgnify:CR=1 FL=1|nr:hypothetical protein [Candidatus Woesebacteria bacterium]